MSGSNINSSSLSLNVANGQRPTPSKIYSFSAVLTAGIVGTVDLRGLQNLNILQQVQGMFVDNSANNASATIEIATGMSILVPGLSQGFFPIFVPPNAPVFNLTGNGTVTVTLTNFALPASVWGNVSLGNVFSGSPLAVKDAALEACIAAAVSALQTTPLYLSGGDAWIPQRLGSMAAFAAVSAAGTTILIAGSPSAFVTGIYASLTPNATLAAAGNLTVTLRSTSIASIAQRTIYVPAAGANLEKLVFDLSSINVVPGATDSIEIVLSAALTAGSLETTIYGGTTAIA